jgi:hypothetical protein
VPGLLAFPASGAWASGAGGSGAGGSGAGGSDAWAARASRFPRFRAPRLGSPRPNCPCFLLPAPRIPRASGILRDRAVFRAPPRRLRAPLRPSVPRRCPLCEDRRFIASIFAKRFFMTKISYTYTVNYLRQEKGLRDHGGGWASVGLDCHLSGDMPLSGRGLGRAAGQVMVRGEAPAANHGDGAGSCGHRGGAGSCDGGGGAGSCDHGGGAGSCDGGGDAGSRDHGHDAGSWGGGSRRKRGPG